MFFVTAAFSQTRSKLFNFSEVNNEAHDLLIAANQEQIFVVSGNTCDYDTTNNIVYFCNKLYSFDFNLKLLNKFDIDSLGGLDGARVLEKDNNIYFSGNVFPAKSKDPFGRPLEISVLDSGLNIVQNIIIPMNQKGSIVNRGLLNQNEYYYAYGYVRDLNLHKSSYIVKIDSAFNKIWEYKGNQDYAFTDCRDLQFIGNNLIFIHYASEDGPGRPDGGVNGIQIMKINLEGHKLDSLLFPLESAPPTLYVSNQGYIYCTTKEHPITPSKIFKSNGRINMYSGNLDTLIWSTPLPWMQYFNRQYDVLDIDETINGDILACGMVWSSGPTSVVEDTLLNLSNNGFIVRLSPLGKIKWLRIYRLPNTNPLLPVKEYGKYWNCFLNNISETKDGRIVVSGNTYYDNAELPIIYAAGEPLTTIWLMVVGSDGCIDGEECQEVIVIDSIKNQFYTGNLINEDYVWNVVVNQDGNEISKRFTFAEDSVYQWGFWGRELLVSHEESGNNWEATGRFFIKSGRKIYQVINGKEFHLVYDFSLEEGESFNFEKTSISPERKYIVNRIDSITLSDGSRRRRITLECHENKNDKVYWVEGIGDLSGILNIKNNDACISDMNSTLLCFYEDGKLMYENGDIGKCWVGTSTTDLSDLGISLYPNPATDMLIISGFSGTLNYTIYSTLGIKLQSGRASDQVIGINDIPPGVYFIRLKFNGKSGTTKFVKSD